MEKFEETLNSYQWLILKRANLLCNNNEEIKQDLIQEGRIGLYKALINFKGGVTFPLYAKNYIDGYMKTFLSRKNRTIHIPQKEVLKIGKGKRQEFGFISTEKELKRNDDEIVYFGSILPDTTTYDDYISKEDELEMINIVLKQLTPIEQEIINMSFGLGDEKYTQQEIADRFNIKKTAVNHIVCKLKKKLKKYKKYII